MARALHAVVAAEGETVEAKLVRKMPTAPHILSSEQMARQVAGWRQGDLTVEKTRQQRDYTIRNGRLTPKDLNSVEQPSENSEIDQRGS
jgi:hypothetical protein